MYLYERVNERVCMGVPMKERERVIERVNMSVIIRERERNTEEECKYKIERE